MWAEARSVIAACARDSTIHSLRASRSGAPTSGAASGRDVTVIVIGRYRPPQHAATCYPRTASHARPQRLLDRGKREAEAGGREGPRHHALAGERHLVRLLTAEHEA